ncbi:hypothetical protein [Sporosarcina psychrophila]|uniref:Phage portal protein n=1 Tax=Sporosarcina psychrophila TaxID=1476 RepID=A0ABV2KAM6_SPOPS
MNLESNMKDIVSTLLTDGTVEKMVEKHFEKCIENALNDLFSSYGDITKVVKEKVKSVMVPYLEARDYSDFIVKLDDVLVEVLKNSATANKDMLENFKDLMIVDKKEEIKASELFGIWKEYVANNVDTDDLEVDFDDRPSYEYVDIRLEVEEDENRSWSSFKYATLIFECEKDEKMNFSIRLSRYVDDRKESWDVRYDKKREISSLRYLNSFEILLMKMDQDGTKIILDTTYENDEVQPEAEPEATYG